MSDRMRATQLKDNLPETDNKPIWIGCIHSPGPLCYEMALKKKTEGVYFVIKEQGKSKPRNRIVLPICNRREFLVQLKDVKMWAEDIKNRSFIDNMGTDFDLASKKILLNKNRRAYHFERFIEEYVPYLRIHYIHGGRRDCMLFDGREMERLISNIISFSTYDPNRMDGEESYDGCAICGGLGIYLFGKPDSYKNKPIVIPSYMDFGKNNRSNVTNDDGENSAADDCRK